MGKKKKKVKRAISAMSDYEKLGRRIRHLRKQAGYTSAMKFAYDHNLSAVQMVRWEQGQNMTFESLLRLAKALNVSVVAILKDFRQVNS